MPIKTLTITTPAAIRSYIYTVTIRGVNDIEVEVTEKKESRPGYEGNVIVSEIKPHELDATTTVY